MTNEIALTTLAAEINTLHAAANDAAATALHYAAQCGAKLNEAKAQCKHGEWLPWLDVNCRVKHDQASKYMKLARDMPELISKSDYSRNLNSINTAIAYLSASEETKAKVDESAEPVTERQIKQWESELQYARQQQEADANKIGELVTEMARLEKKLQERPTIERVINPPDYDAAKQALVDLEKEKAELKAKADQAEIAAQQAKAKVDAIERAKRKAIQEGLQAELAKVEDNLKRAEAQESIYEERAKKAKEEYKKLTGRNAAIQRRHNASEKVRLALVSLAAELYDAVDDGYDLEPHEVKLWAGVAQQMEGAAKMIREWLPNMEN